MNFKRHLVLLENKELNRKNRFSFVSSERDCYCHFWNSLCKRALANSDEKKSNNFARNRPKILKKISLGRGNCSTTFCNKIRIIWWITRQKIDFFWFNCSFVFETKGFFVETRASSSFDDKIGGSIQNNQSKMLEKIYGM